MISMPPFFNRQASGQKKNREMSELNDLILSNAPNRHLQSIPPDTRIHRLLGNPWKHLLNRPHLFKTQNES